MSCRLRYLCLALGLLIAACAQSTEGLIAGRVTDAITGAALEGATVEGTSPATNTVWTVETDSAGRYALPLLPPGTYHLRVSLDDYQAKEQFELALGVSGSIDLDFALRPLSDIWEHALRKSVVLPQNAAIVDFYGPDVDPNYWSIFNPNPGKPGKLDASISDAVSPTDITELPLAGRNIYTILLAEPGVAANNLITRSLGIAANGQRPSSSNFLLDGADANFYLATGPVVSVAPEAVQEYRLSSNNFSAEFGGAAGYIANAVTRSGGNAWHGQGFFDLQNTVLNSGEFFDNANGYPRARVNEDRIGGFAGGPLLKNRLFSGTSFEYFRSRDHEQTQVFGLPNSTFFQRIGCPSTGPYCMALKNYRPPPPTALDPYVAAVPFAPPVSIDQWLAVQRLDYASPRGSQHASLRLAVSDYGRPDFIWSPYPDYTSGLDQPVYNLAANWTAELRPGIDNRLAAAWSDQRLQWSRAHPETPILGVLGGNPGAVPVLPGSPAAFGDDNSSRYFQVNDSALIVRGAHIVKFGGGGFWRRTNDDLGYGLGGEFEFCNILAFGLLTVGCPSFPTFIPAVQATTVLARGAAVPTAPEFHRAYRSPQAFGFAQDTLRILPRLTLDSGLRYDWMGAPAYNGGTRDWSVQFGKGATFPDRIRNATLEPPSASPSSLFAADNRGLAPRLGFAYDLSPSHHAILRGGFGLFYDRLFDNLWLDARNNSFVLPPFVKVSGLNTIASVIPSLSVKNASADYPDLTAFQPRLRNGYAEDLFFGIETQPAPAWSVDVNGAASLGRRLTTTDLINRNSLTNDSLAPIRYLGNQGISDYYSLNLVLRWRGHHGFLQAAYSWSHAIDLESDPKQGVYSDFTLATSPSPIRPTTSAINPDGIGFSSPYDSRGNRGSADFDQRHTLVFYSYWQVPAIGPAFVRRALAGLRFSQIAAIRSGFPYSIFTAIADPESINAYARTSLKPASVIHPRAVLGGQQLFTASEFCPDNTCSDPSTSRNEFAGPGLVNLDVSASRSFRLHRLGESRSLLLRADFFNFLNHANLNPPLNLPGGADFGVALYGRPAQTTGFPSVEPLGPAARQIQLMLKILF